VEHKSKILIVDDDQNMKNSLLEWLESENHQVRAASSGEEAVEMMAVGSFNIVITDLRMPGIDGLELLRYVRREHRDTEVIIMTAYGSVPTAVNAMKEGAYDYVVKPFSPEEIDMIVKKITDHQSLIRENILLKEQLQERHRFESLIGKSTKMQDIYALVENLAPTNITVLIQGESGTGKELIARAIHNASLRKEHPFISVSCGALPDTLLESELFGHEKGAFTGAIAKKQGRFEMADKGTLFLDEITDMSPKSQVDLLRVLQEKEFRRVGGSELIKVDVRIIAATNKDLDKEVQANRFRDDLYYRLHVAPVHVPPLRDRHEDIPLLVRHFLQGYAREYKRDVREVSPKAFNLLLQYSWPGNVRELEHVIEHSLLMTKGNTIMEENLPDKLKRRSKASDQGALPNMETRNLRERVEQFEKQNIIKALGNAGGVKKKAATMLGISSRNLSYFLKKYGITSGER
jgi:DNA-binding NtrC family response regulator